ncbi:MAG: hypothetical protein HY796_05185 [Elusimicrobia bacterium]|nr:hypothetical protein [Elusimicrobiota bacterium]
MPASENKPPIKTGQSDTIPITVDKSHLVTIGERLYSESEEPRRKTRVGKLKLKQLSSSALVKKLKIDRHGLALIMDHFGAESPESFTEGEIIHINRDHPLFIREATHITRFLKKPLNAGLVSELKRQQSLFFIETKEKSKD